MREAYGERRFLSLGLLEDQVVSVAHTDRGEDIRIISIRQATKHEARFYFSQIVDYSLKGSENDRRGHCSRRGRT
jgi:uncharacterized DUF497 family protein